MMSRSYSHKYKRLVTVEDERKARSRRACRGKVEVNDFEDEEEQDEV